MHIYLDINQLEILLTESKRKKIWQFLLHLLLDPDKYGDIIEWINRDTGLFLIIDKYQVSRIWGERRGGHNMTYEKMSRAMRLV